MSNRKQLLLGLLLATTLAGVTLLTYLISRNGGQDMNNSYYVNSITMPCKYLKLKLDASVPSGAERRL